MDTEYDLEDWPLKTALGLEENDMVAMIEIQEGSDYENAASENLLMRDDDIHLLFIRRGNVILRKSLFQVELLAGDRVMIFGDENTIKEKFSDMLTEDAR
jgi:uncharacterized protein with PhoU and TrkA domain